MPADFDKDEVFKQLYDTHRERLRRYLRSLGILDNLDDIIQEAFLRLYDRMGNLDRPIEREKLVAYLNTVARNLAFDYHRHMNRAGRIETGVDDIFFQDIADRDPLPEEVYEEKELLEDLAKAIADLPENIAEAVKGLLDGKTCERIAFEIGIQVPALKYRLRKARNLLHNMRR
jgi:RNA polymerase sigma factor (sigma-70 family)